ncbi:MAG TPA: beta-glucuronidase [Candidatus Monoglobus merdigallinarum]|uniref:Beta-glucuronidase n=1 Tax=Candidatus Monoglobus merdigallinarum TaxID=2838698 RepID=A0A9D1PR88_9FIRM|nr:beta-glucuronidase [Candidatus Monoglobus merdigallinarum]
MLDTQALQYPRNTSTRRLFDLSGLWKFKFDSGACGEENGWQYGLSDYILMPVPASFNDFFTDKNSREYTGDFWYERDFIVPGEWEGMSLFLRFEGAAHRAEVYINGKKTVSHEGGFMPFAARLDGLVKFDKPNRVAVKINNELSLTSLPAGSTKLLKNGRKMSKPFFDFFNYSGLNRAVKLVAVPKESILDLSVEHKLTEDGSETKYSVTTNGDNTVQVSVFDKDGSIVAETTGKEGVIHIENTRLWNVLDAYLYTFRLRILKSGSIIDEYYEDIGIRTVEIKGRDILINNKPVYLKGFGKHEDSDIIGRGFSLPVAKRDFELMKWIGANSFRTSHYPYAEEILKMADREGFLVIDEVAAVGMFESLMNFLEASSGKKTDFFSRDIVQTQTKENHKAAVSELITRDKNHACVIAWSLFNEPETTSDSAVKYFEEIFIHALKTDPQKRPRTFALIMNSTPSVCKCYGFSDFLSLNRYYGWYVNGGYEISDAKEQLIDELKEWEKAAPNKPIIFTEFGADTMPGLHKLPSVMWSEEYQEEYLNMQFEVFDMFDSVKGEQVWNFADFQTTEGILRVDGNKKGIFTRARQPKNAAYLFKKRWESLALDYKSTSSCRY